MSKISFNVEVDDAFGNKLKALAKQKGTSQNEIIKRSVITYQKINELIQDGQKLSITNSEDVVIKDIILY